VLDRTGLILEIFGRRAKTKEGALQVELAHLNYQRSRLVRSWTHLERQRGGFGFMGGPGETQIEADRRLISERITKLEGELKKVQATRRLHRAGRQRVPYRVVALVGYTNAGKSTLFNRLTRADVQAADMLFATLDPTLRALSLPHGGKAMLSDTVGFISNLPTQLVAAFRATLEEVLEADIILHVRDISHEDAEAQERDVEGVLRQLGIDADADGGQRIIEVWNKIDLIPVERASAAASCCPAPPPGSRRHEPAGRLGRRADRRGPPRPPRTPSTRTGIAEERRPLSAWSSAASGVASAPSSSTNLGEVLEPRRQRRGCATVAALVRVPKRKRSGAS
jgi:GTP-binding protein HflX